MIRYILIFIGLCFILWQPWLLFLAAAITLLLVLVKRPNSFTALSDQRRERVNEPAPDLPRDKGFMTYEERTEQEMSRIKFKEGFEKDPEWLAQAKKAREHIQKARDLEDAALRAEGQNIKNWA